jgi:hypothetical protein
MDKYDGEEEVWMARCFDCQMDLRRRYFSKQLAWYTEVVTPERHRKFHFGEDLGCGASLFLDD